MQFDRDATHVQDQSEDGVQDTVVALRSDAEAPAVARAFVTGHRDHLPDDLLEDALLLVSEVVTNAVQHGRDAIVLRVRTSSPGIGIAVADGGDPMPEMTAGGPRHAASGATRARGMAIVDAVSSAWGVVDTEPPPGKTVWFELLTSSR